MRRVITGLAALLLLSACQSNTTLSDTLAAGIEPVTIDELLENGEDYDKKQIWVRGYYYTWPGHQLCLRKTTLEERDLSDEEKKCIPIAYTNTSVDPPAEALVGKEIAIVVRYSLRLCNNDNPCVRVSETKRPEGGNPRWSNEQSLRAARERPKEEVIRMLVLLDPPGSEQQAK